MFVLKPGSGGLIEVETFSGDDGEPAILVTATPVAPMSIIFALGAKDAKRLALGLLEQADNVESWNRGDRDTP